jgi:hypothetical protein
VQALKTYSWSVTAIDPVNPANNKTSTASFTTKAAPAEPVAACNSMQTAGFNIVDERLVQLGKAAGKFLLEYGTYDIADRVIVKQGGRELWNSGCVSTGSVESSLAYQQGVQCLFVSSDGSSCSRPFHTEISFSGSDTVTVRVEPGCNQVQDTGETEWGYYVHCP